MPREPLRWYDEGIGLRTAKSCGPDASTRDGAV
jgi:hypothetical protein